MKSLSTVLSLSLIALLNTLSAAQAHAASSFQDTKNVIMDDSAAVVLNEKVAEELAIYRANKLPQYKVNSSSIFEFGTSQLESDAHRTFKEKADYLERLPKLVHSNGVCVTGTWDMNTDNVHTGAFSAGRKSLFVGRISVAMEETSRGSKRGFGFAGKIFPTLNPDEIVATENFFSVDVLMGTKVPKFLETSMTNEPELGFDLWAISLGLKIAKVFSKADSNPGFRSVQNLSMQGLEAGSDFKGPHWIRISADSKTILNNQADFRNEVLQAVKDNGVLTFDIMGSDKSKDRSQISEWKLLGKIKIDTAKVSYGCDRRLHFSHPRLP